MAASAAATSSTSCRPGIPESEDSILEFHGGDGADLIEGSGVIRIRQPDAGHRWRTLPVR